MNRGVGGCFAEVEVDTWTGDWRFLKAAYCHDSGTSSIRCWRKATWTDRWCRAAQVATDAIPWDKEFPGDPPLQCRVPLVPAADDHGRPGTDQRLHQQPRAAVVLRLQGLRRNRDRSSARRARQRHLQRLRRRIREHPITREKIMAGLKTKGEGGRG